MSMPQRIATAPAAQAERELRRALAGVPMGRLTDPSAVLPAGHAADVLGSANLAFTDPAHFAGPGASPGLVIREMPVTDQRMQRLLASVSAADAAETDLARMDSAVQVVLDGDRAVAAASSGSVLKLATASTRGVWLHRQCGPPELGRRRRATAAGQHRRGGWPSAPPVGDLLFRCDL
jgi:L-aminopeptidase/D-esterase-like protein